MGRDIPLAGEPVSGAAAGRARTLHVESNMAKIRSLNYGEEIREGESHPDSTPVPIVAPSEPVEAPAEVPAGV